MLTALPSTIDWDGVVRVVILGLFLSLLATLYLGGLAWFLVALRVKNLADRSGRAHFCTPTSPGLRCGARGCAFPRVREVRGS